MRSMTREPATRMKVLVDTSIWSLALRRKTRAANEAIATALASLVQDGRVAIIGPIRQELLSGLEERVQFVEWREPLHAFLDIEITSED